MNQLQRISVLAVAAISMFACESSTTKVVRSGLIGNEDAAFLFWDQLANEVVVSNEDVLYALLEVKNGEPPVGDWVAIQQAAKDEGILYCDKELVGDHAATWGTVGYATSQILSVEGGFMMRTFGPNPRWCLNELYYLGVIPKHSENEAIRGLEFTSVIDVIDQRRSEVDESPIEL
tara:strand:+ start:41 stop:568 length:528 start_codon:yes stop_codon:yes gene_type:complete